MAKPVSLIVRNGNTNFSSQKHCHDSEVQKQPRRCSIKKAFLKVSQNSQEKTSAKVSLFFNKVVRLVVG